MSLVKRHWVVLAAAAATAIGVPAWRLEPEPRSIDAPPGVAVTELSMSSIGGIGAALSAPIFSPSRLPADVVAAGGEEAGPQPAPGAAAVPALVGIVTRARGRGVALVKGAAGETVMIEPGEIVDGWRLAAIGSDRAEFTQGGERQVVTLDFGARAGTAIRAQPSIPPPPPEGSPLEPLSAPTSLESSLARTALPQPGTNR